MGRLSTSTNFGRDHSETICAECDLGFRPSIAWASHPAVVAEIPPLWQQSPCLRTWPDVEDFRFVVPCDTFSAHLHNLWADK